MLQRHFYEKRLCSKIFSHIFCLFLHKIMKEYSSLIAFLLALFASIGNVLFTFGQKKAGEQSNPFVFGVLSLFIGAVILLIVALFFKTKHLNIYLIGNAKWFIISGLGYAMLNVGMYFLFRNFGTSYYTLYATLSIVSTSILLSVLVFNEKMNIYLAISVFFAFLTIFFFMKGQELNKKNEKIENVTTK